jgi:hypothetical protein
VPDFPDISPIAVADGLFVVAATAQIRKWLPKIDGWWAVALVVLLSAGAGMRHAGRPVGPLLDYLAIVGMHTAAVVVMAFGGMEALKSRIAKALSTGLPPSIPPPAAVLLLVLVAPSLTGCGADPKLAAFADKIATVSDIALSCEAGRYESEQRACLNKPNPEACVALVRQREQAAKEAFDGLHATACALSPNAEGCP